MPNKARELPRQKGNYRHEIRILADKTRIVVTGRPKAGKTTFCRSLPGWTIWDLDIEAAKLGYPPRFPRTPQQTANLISLREAFLSSWGPNSAVIITSLKQASAAARRTGASLVECIAGDAVRRAKDVPSVESPQWRRFRAAMLRRRKREAADIDEAICVQCAAEGKPYGPQQVHYHHIKPRSEWPQLMYEPSNLEFLCIPHHNQRR